MNLMKSFAMEFHFERILIMEKAKRILAFAGAVLLIGMYICTLIFSLIDSPVATNLLKASVAATILIPVLLYGLLLFTKLMHRDDD